MSTISLQSSVVRQASVAEKTAAIPWTIWCAFAGVACGTLGGLWDISWHMSIGRDTFWTPAHIAIQMTGVLVGIACGYTILTTTFGQDEARREASVGILGFRGPVGAFIATWGCIAMLTSAPFDNWWHNAYGLDVKIVSPPHTLLSFGSLAIKVGVMAMMASVMNREEGVLRRRLTWLFLFVGATGVGQLGVMLTETTWVVYMHTALCYLSIAMTIPVVMVGAGWGASRKWACTIIASMYTAVLLAFEWILPLFPAEPKLGPVYQHVTHMVPLRFPLLLIVPAIVVDLILRKTEDRPAWFRAAFAGPAFVLSLMAVQWPFANFLLSPAARNAIFGSGYFAYFDPANFVYDPYQFRPVEKSAGAFLVVMVIALAASVLTTRLGLAWGEWMRRVRR